MVYKLPIVNEHIHVFVTYMITDTITKRNTNAPPMDSPNINGQSTSPSPSSVLGLAGTVNVSPVGSPDGSSPLMASCKSLAGIVELLSGLMTTKLTAPVSGSICTRTLSLVKVLMRNEY